MSLCLRIVTIAVAIPLWSGTLCAQQGVLRYAGTAGQQLVTLLLEVPQDTVTGGHYHYDRQAGEVRIVDCRQFGTTLVLQDEDGNILHLHFEDAAGGKTGSLRNAAMLEGTLDRGELDLPVKLKRVDTSP